MNKCLYCGKDVKNKFCGVSCQNSYSNATRMNDRLGIKKEFTMKCEKCGKDFVVVEREKQHPQRKHYFCSRACANGRVQTEEANKKRSVTLCNRSKNIPKMEYKNTCKICGKIFVSIGKTKKTTCSKECCKMTLSLGGRNSASKQGEKRRSKNEMYFYALCGARYTNVTHNQPIFNGWDADIIIPDKKVAVLWNGKWHYEKITEKHSVEQVQNRDRIKIKEIERAGYKAYVIKDLGKENKKFVETQFGLFVKEIEKTIAD